MVGGEGRSYIHGPWWSPISAPSASKNEHDSLMRYKIVVLPSKTLSSARAKSSASERVVQNRGTSFPKTPLRNGRRKPSVPMEKLKTGGTAPDLNKEDACKIVPSPPSVITRSIFSDLGPGGSR